MNVQEREKELEKIHLCRTLAIASCEDCRVVHVEVAELAKYQTPPDLLAMKLEENQIIHWCSVCKKAKVFTRVEL